MPRATAEPPVLGTREGRGRIEPAWQPRPRRGGPRAQLAWLLLMVKLFCLQNVNWLLSAGFHAALTLCIAGVALQHHRNSAGVGLEGGLFEGTGEEGFENVLGADGQAGGGGTPFESTLEPIDTAPQSSGLNSLNELIKMSGGGTVGGDGGEGGGSGGGSGGGHGSGIGLGAGFFGSKGAGKSFVYVVDCSGSMYGHRFNRAKTELVRSINKLKPEQKFYVYFFNDRTFPLFDPKPAPGMLPAIRGNVERASRWIRSRQPESTTNPNLALKQALEMKPEVIFLLTDGELDDAAEVRQMILRNNKSNVVIHTIAFENEEASATLEAIAKENNGTFRFVK